MISKKTLLAAGMAVLVTFGTTAPAAAHGPGFGGGPVPHGWHQGWYTGPGMTHHGMMGHGCGMGGYGTMGPGMGHGMMGSGMGHGMMGPGMGHGMMGPGMGHGMAPGMMGPGMMMGPGYGSGDEEPPAMGPGMGRQGMHGQGMAPGMGGGMMDQPRQAISVEDVQAMLERRLAMWGNPNVKLGKVEERDADTIVAEIVTQDDSLVERMEIDRRTGWMRMIR